MVLCTPTVIGEKTGGANALDAQLDEYADISRKVAKDTGATLCDLRKAFVDHLKAGNKDNKEKGVLTSDRVHLNEAGNNGLLFGNPGQFVTQAIAVVTAIVYSGAVSFILLKIVGMVFPLRATDADQAVGLDLTAHGEEAYSQSGSEAV